MTTARQAIKHERGMIVGLDWWGTSVYDIAARVRLRYDVQAVAMWDLSDPLDRRILDSCVEVPWGSAKSALALRSLKDMDWALVLSPHRVPTAALSRIRKRSSRLIALIGDVPTGSREVPNGYWKLFDVIALADGDWEDAIPPEHRGRIAIEGWGSTVTDPALLGANLYEPNSIALVGAAYTERVALATELAREFRVVCQGPDWPTGPYLRRPAAPRDETIRTLRRNRELLINVHHSQFARGLNPQYYDYAACAVPQIVVHPADPNPTRTVKRELAVSTSAASPRVSDLFDGAAYRSIVQCVRSTHMFEHTIERLLEA